MGWREVLTNIGNALNITLFDIGGTTVTLATALSGLLVIIATVWVSRIVQRGVRRVLMRRGVEAESTLGTVAGLIHYTLLVAGFGVALQTIGIDLAALFAAGAIFAIGLGFAMQNIAQNFVAGFIMLAERAIKPGDVLEVEGVVVRVRQSGIRATIVETRDGEDLIVPNSILVQSTVKNYTLADSMYRVRTTVGVVYGSDMALVRKTLQRVADGLDWRLEERDPQVLLVEFGNHSVNWEVAVWMSDPWLARPALSKINEAVWWAFQELEIVIAFPQLDVHFDEPVEAGLRALGSTR